MTTTYEIPFTAQPQTFSCKLGANTYQLTLLWSEPNNSWLLNLDDNSGNRIISSIPLVTGQNLLGQFDYLGIGGGLYAETTNKPFEVPTYDNIGTESHVYFVTI